MEQQIINLTCSHFTFRLQFAHSEDGRGRLYDARIVKAHRFLEIFGDFFLNKNSGINLFGLLHRRVSILCYLSFFQSF